MSFKPNASAFLDDMAKLASGAAGSVFEMRHELETMVQEKLERAVSGLGFVTREEFETVKAMAEKARAENEALRALIAEKLG